MLLLTRKYLALAATALAVVGSTGCSQKKSSDAGVPDTASAKVTVSTAAVVQSDITRITLTVSGAAAPAMSPMRTSLTKAGNVWTGNLTGIPALAGGSVRTFLAQAYNASNQVIYQGQTDATVVANNTARVTILMQQTALPPSTTNYAPVIDAITSSNAYVLPSTVLTFGVSAHDPDHVTSTGGRFDGEPLVYGWSSHCTGTGGDGAFDSSTVPTVHFTSPATSATCTIAVTVTEGGAVAAADRLSVTTFFNIEVNGNFGDAYVFAFPNTSPIVTVSGDLRWNYFNNILDQFGATIPVGIQGDFRFAATDSDGDDLRYDVRADCGTTLASLTNPYGTPYWSADSLTTVTGSQFNPAFGHGLHAGGAVVTAVGNPNQDCRITLDVHDLCTNGNCVGDPSAVGTIANGSFKTYNFGSGVQTSVTSVVINGTRPAIPVKAPQINYASNGASATMPLATKVASWDPPRIVLVDANTAGYAMAVDATDPQGGTPTVTWGCFRPGTPDPVPVGAVAAATTTFDPGAVTTVHSETSWTSPAVLALGMYCTATVRSSVTNLSTVVTYQFQANDPCVKLSLAPGAICNDNNKCNGEGTLETATCDSNLVCGGNADGVGAHSGTPVVCNSNNACVVDSCDANQGCVTTPKPATTSCDADGSGCTQNDHCDGGGACVGGAAVVCNTPADVQCQVAAGTCGSTGVNTFSCSYTSVANGTACNFDNNGCTQNDSCQGGACTVGAAVTCSQTGVACKADLGTCVNDLGNAYHCTFPNLADGTGCNSAGACVTGQTCSAGACAGGTPYCTSGQRCFLSAGPQCATVFNPTAALDLRLSPPAGIAMDTAGNTFVAGGLAIQTAVNWQTAAGGNPAISLGSLGATDIFAARYDAAGNIAWAVGIADDDTASTNDQYATGAAVTNDGHVALIGKIVGLVTFGTTSVNGASPMPFVGALNAADGSRAWVNGYNLGSNGQFNAVAANPSTTGVAANRIAVCGQANIRASQFVGAGTYGGGNSDLVIGVFNGAGGKSWALQLGGAGNETCNAVAIDDNGDVYATGQFDGATLAFPGGPTLTSPGVSTRKYMWVAKFDGTTGATLAAAAFGSQSSGSANPQGIAVATSGQVFVGGNFSGDLLIGAGMASAGGDDAFLAKLTSSLAPAWNAVRFGGSGFDKIASVATTSTGDVLVTGTVNPSSPAFRTANGGFDTTGAIQLNVNGTTSPDIFVVKFNGAAGLADGGKTYGNNITQNGDSIVVNRFGTDQVALSGTLTGAATFGTAGTVTAQGASDVALVFGNLQ
jgi:hypothetical protein